jgi:hypothetical protein
MKGLSMCPVLENVVWIKGEVGREGANGRFESRFSHFLTSPD